MRFALIGLAVLTVAAGLSVMTTGAVAVDLPASTLSSGQGELRIEAVDDATGVALPVRVRVVPARMWRDERVLVDRHGKLRTPLLPGSYRIHVTHGPEWSVLEQTVLVVAGEVSTLQARLHREVDATRFTACDLHVHTAESPDSNLALQDRISTLLAEDVQFVVLSDHNHVTNAEQTLARAGIASLPGVEVTTWAPELGHFNVFPRQSAPPFKHADAAELLRALRSESGSFVQINHPRLEGHIGYFELAAFDRTRGQGSDDFPLDFDGIEVWNGYDLASPARRDEVFLDWLAMVARGRHITATGNSDSHKAGLAPHVGYPRTYVQVPRAEALVQGKVLAALKQGRAFVTNGPIIDLTVQGKQPGETVSLSRHERTVSVRVQVDAPAWMQLREVELWLGTSKVSVLAIRPRASGAGHAVVTLQVPVHAQRSLVATVRGDASMKPLLGRSSITPYAFTNPVWIARR